MIPQFVKDLIRKDSPYDVHRIQILSAAIGLVIAGMCMCAAFMYRVISQPQKPPDYWAFGLGIGLVFTGHAVGVAAMARKPKTEDT